MLPLESMCARKFDAGSDVGNASELDFGMFFEADGERNRGYFFSPNLRV